MALNFTKSYTFAPSTTISSSQVNTNFDEIASVFQGLEAETKTLSKLKIDADPTLALEVASKQYVDHYAGYRRPVLQYASATVVNLETGINGTSGQAQILFPDGSLRTDSTAGHINFDITRNCALSGSAQSGLRATLSEATSTWYALYAVKITDSTGFVVVGDTRLPLVANFADINTAFGANSWVYLGLIRNGDNSGTTGDILNFVQNGDTTIFIHANNKSLGGTLLATTASATSLTYTYAAGTGAAQIPNNVGHIVINATGTPGATNRTIFQNAAGTIIYFNHGTNSTYTDLNVTTWVPASGGWLSTLSSAGAANISCAGFRDSVLGVGSNPLL